MRPQFKRDDAHRGLEAAGRLEALLEEPEDAAPQEAALVCHPHPQHGGTMDNKVVQTLARALRQIGYRTVRFNFRGVGGSPTSQHVLGEAADIVAPSVTVEELHRWIVTESGLPYGQCILEKTAPARPYSWVHVSLGEPWRKDTLCRQALVYDGAGHYTTWEPK